MSSKQSVNPATLNSSGRGKGLDWDHNDRRIERNMKARYKRAINRGTGEPLISIVIPVYNRVVMLQRALNSIRDQAYGSFEVIVVDDGSDDDPTSAVKAFNDPRFRIVRQDKQGAAAARNYGARLAKGTYLTFLDSDDEVLPVWLSLFKEGFENDSACVVCLGIERLGNDGALIAVSVPETLGRVYRDIRAKFLAGTYALRRNMFINLGGFDVNLPAGHHTDFSLRLCDHLGFNQDTIICIERIGIRIHDHGGAKIRRDHRAIVASANTLLRKHAEAYSRSPRVTSQYLATAAVSAFKIGEQREGVALLRRACLTHPKSVKNWLRMGISLTGLGVLVWREKSGR